MKGFTYTENSIIFPVFESKENSYFNKDYSITVISLVSGSTPDDDVLSHGIDIASMKETTTQSFSAPITYDDNINLLQVQIK